MCNQVARDLAAADGFVESVAEVEVELREERGRMRRQVDGNGDSVSVVCHFLVAEALAEESLPVAPFTWSTAWRPIWDLPAPNSWPAVTSVGCSVTASLLAGRRLLRRLARASLNASLSRSTKASAPMVRDERLSGGDAVACGSLGTGQTLGQLSVTASPCTCRFGNGKSMAVVDPTNGTPPATNPLCRLPAQLVLGFPIASGSATAIF